MGRANPPATDRKEKHVADDLIIVTGVTGAQGGATIDALFDRGIGVRVLVRNPDVATGQAMTVC